MPTLTEVILYRARPGVAIETALIPPTRLAPATDREPSDRSNPPPRRPACELRRP